MIGNLKESALPYMLEHMRLAKMSFDLWGALSPTGSKAPPGGGAEVASKQEQSSNGAKQEERGQASAKRSMSQAELESSLYKVNRIALFK